MGLQSYYTNPLTTASQIVMLTRKFTVNAATGVVTSIEGKRTNVTAGTATGVLTVTLPQIFRQVPYIHAYVIDTALAGLNVIVTSDITNVSVASSTGPSATSQFTMTLTKLTSGAPAAVTTGTYTIGLFIVAAA